MINHATYSKHKYSSYGKCVLNSVITIWLVILQVTSLNSQNVTSNCIEILKENASVIKSRNNLIGDENKIIEQLRSCHELSFSKTDLYNILGEPNGIKHYYSGIEKANFQAMIYYMKPTYKSKSFIGQAIQFQFREGEENCFKIERIRYCE